MYKSKVLINMEGIRKNIIHYGFGCSRDKNIEYSEGSKFIFHYVCKIGDKTLDDSRKWNKQDFMELVSGKKFKLEVWEICLKTMFVGEISSYNVDKKLVRNYPYIAKHLRDSFDSRKSSTKKKHMCSMVALQINGIGYKDLDMLIKQPSDLEFIIELIAVKKPFYYNKEVWEMSYTEKLVHTLTLKKEGNSLFQQKNYSGALSKYHYGLNVLEQLILREKPKDNNWVKLNKYKIPFLLNSALCSLKNQDYYKVIFYCNEILELEPENIKALFRRGKGNAGVSNYSQAKCDFLKVSQLDISLKEMCQKEIKKLETIIITNKAKEIKVFEKMFSN